MKRYALIYLIAVICLLGTCGILLFALPEKSFSPQENRYLATLPAPDSASVLSGDWQKDFSAFTADQLPARNTLVALSAALRLGVGYRDVGGAYVGRDGFYFEKLPETGLDHRQFSNNLQTLNTWLAAHSDLDAHVLLAPSAGTVLPEKLPPLATLYDADALYAEAAVTLRGCTVSDVRDTLRTLSETQQVYYRTDHHWTTAGAAAACRELCRAAGWNFAEPALAAVTEDFLGTLYSKVLDSRAQPDTVLAAPVPEGLTVEADGKPSAVYDSSALSVKDKYRYFFGGNYGQVVIRNGEAASDRVLLVVKDSFANCLVPLLTEDFSAIVMIDLRYFNGSLDEVIAAEGVTDALVLYEISNFAADTNVVKLLF